MAESHRTARHSTPRASVAPFVVIGLVTVVVAALVAGFLVFGSLVGEGFGYFSKEPAETLNVHRFIGWQAHLTVLVSAFGAAIALFAGLLVRRQCGSSRASAFLLGAGSFTTLLVLDDFLQFHDYVYPRLLGVGEALVYPTYALLAGVVAWRWGRDVARTDMSIALLAAAWLAVSVGVDQVVTKAWPYFHVVEDGAKMLGFTLWAVYLVRTSMRLTLAASGPSEPPATVPTLREEWVPRPEDVQETMRCTAVSPSGVAELVMSAQIPVPRVELNPIRRHRADRAGRSPGSPAAARQHAPPPLTR